MPEDLKKIKSELEKVSALVVALSLTQKDHNIPTFKKIDKDISTINEGLDGVNKSIEGIKESLITLDTATKKDTEDKLSLFEAKVQSIKDMIPTLKDGETPSDEKLVSLIKPLIPNPEKGDKGDTPVAGVDFPLPEDGITPTNEELIDLIKPLIPPVKDGSPDTAEDIRNKLELLQGDERLDVDYIRGVEELIDDKISEIPIPKERGGRGGVVQFTALVDTPSSYVGQAGKVATVNATETALEFTTPTGGAGGTPASSVTDETTYGITPAVGTSTNFARQDHTHGTPTTPTKTTVGLANVDNTSDANKPVSTA